MALAAVALSGCILDIDALRGGEADAADVRPDAGAVAPTLVGLLGSDCLTYDASDWGPSRGGIVRVSAGSSVDALVVGSASGARRIALPSGSTSRYRDRFDAIVTTANGVTYLGDDVGAFRALESATATHIFLTPSAAGDPSHRVNRLGAAVPLRPDTSFFGGGDTIVVVTDALAYRISTDGTDANVEEGVDASWLPLPPVRCGSIRRGAVNDGALVYLLGETHRTGTPCEGRPGDSKRRRHRRSIRQPGAGWGAHALPFRAERR
jgi:hypothetical protein